VTLLISIVGVLLGSLSLLLGFCTRAGALALFAITIGATVTMHDYWHLQALQARVADFDIFARNVAIAGGLLFLIGMGSGRFALDNKGPPPQTAGNRSAKH
jgi:putative oxidoreductase